ncbi:MAG: hypothetical protein WBD59_12275 [Candidatus Sulfotelmatobacter sp.]
MRLWLVALCVFLYLQSQPPSTGKRSQEEQNSAQTKRGQSNFKESSSQPPIAVCSQTVTETGKERTPQEKQKSSTDFWLTVFTAALVGVAVLQFIAMHRQAEFMRHGLRISIRAARAASRAANAAAVNADALIDAERAWFDLVTVPYPGINQVTVRVVNHGKQFGILNDFTLIYARMTQAQYDALPQKLEREDFDWDAVHLAKQVFPNGGILVADGRPGELETIDLGAFVTKRDMALSDVFYFRVDYQTISQECYTELVYLLREVPIAHPYFELVHVPGLTHYE